MLKTEVIDAIIGRYNGEPSGLIMILQDIQAHYNYIPGEAIDYLAHKLSLPASRIYGVTTFYKSLSLKPRGKNKIDICEGTACHIRGASLLMSNACDELKVKPGATTADGQFSLNSVHCVGACAMGPVAIINGEYHGNMTNARLTRAIKNIGAAKEEDRDGQPTPQPESEPELDTIGRINSVHEFAVLREQLTTEKTTAQAQILVCNGTGCLARGSMAVAAALKKELHAVGANIELSMGVKKVGCHGLCEKGPLIIFHPEKLYYTRVTPEDAAEIVQETVLGKKQIDRLLYRDSEEEHGIEQYTAIPFYSGQTRIALRRVGLIDPLVLGDYIANGGYSALIKTLTEMKPSEVISAVESSGLRGRGGGGFPAGRKWKTAASIESATRYVLCNGDEGDPGAFMDCSIMEGDPHSVLEGMIICAYAVGSSQGYIYVREEYPRALEHLQIAIRQARKAGFLGENICGSGFSFDIGINRGAGAFVCGESTALMQSVEGKVGEPRAKYIRSAERGLYDMPTVLNNVETYANIPAIMEKGPAWFTSFGTENNSGTKVFSVVGKVKNTGLVEVPLGTTLRRIIFDICGGILDNKAFKAVQTGGPSGGCLPSGKLDLPVDFDTLTREGSMMGSGGMIIMDEDTCMVDVARYFTEFLTTESCGKCSACRLGLDQLHLILDKICRGEGGPEDMGRMEKLLTVLEQGSLCGLGKSAPNPVRSTLTHFREEYLAHIDEKRCPAGVCRSLITYEINADCTGCGRCARLCPQEAISGEKKQLHQIDEGKCNRCSLCLAVCNFSAVDKVSRGRP